VLIGVDQPDCSAKKIDDQNVDRDQRRADDLLQFDDVAPSNNPFWVSDHHVPSHREELRTLPESVRRIDEATRHHFTI
jgi:hypothetical protein